MVYTTLKVVLGFIITNEELIQLLDLKLGENESHFDYDIENLFNDLGYDRKIELYSFPCCSESRGKLFLINITMHKYYRKMIKCEKCKEYTVCDSCIGYTNNGYYDVDTIFNKPTEINVRQICPWCFHDNGCDLGGPQTTASQPTDYDPSIRKQCTVCNLKPDIRRSPGDYMIWKNHHMYTRLETIQKDHEFKQPIKIYHVIDDCLSCS